MRETKEIKALRGSIANHEQALAGVQAKADAAAGRLSAYMQKQIRARAEPDIPGRAAVAFLDFDAERDRLNAEVVKWNAEVNRLGIKLDDMRRLLDYKLQIA